MAAWRNSKENKSGLVQCITELIRVGSYETLLKDCNQPIKVIAIVGRQSGGSVIDFLSIPDCFLLFKVNLICSIG
jgi:hypothetical protein